MINPRYAKKSHMESMAVDTFAELRGRPLDILCVTLCVRACIDRSPLKITFQMYSQSLLVMVA